MTCPLPTPEARRRQVSWLIRHTEPAKKVLLRAQLYAEVPAEGLAEEQGLEPKSRCSVCWKMRPLKLKWKEFQEGTRYTCASRRCYRLWLLLTQAEEQVQAEAQARLVEAVAQGVSP